MAARPALALTRGSGPSTRTDTTRIAAIDIGSNSVRQIIADVSADGTIRIIDEMKAAPRLGAGVSASGALLPEAMDAAIESLGRMATLARQMGAARVEAVATSAVRDAANGDEFVRRVRMATGLRVRAVTGDQEARLSFRSALAHFELGVGRAVVMDIGGGSLELVLSADGLIERLISLPFGAIRLTEQFDTASRPRQGLRRLRRHVREALRDALPARDWRRPLVIGSGGTFTNLAGMVLARQGVDTPSVHGTHVTRDGLEHVLDLLAELSPAERLLVPGLNPGRADIILAGLAVAAEVLARVEGPHIVVSAYGIREGLLLESARVAATVADPGEARARSVREFAQRCHYEEPHARHVQTLALSLFDALGSSLGCEPEERQALADAALLHDVGYHINYDKHHKHSYHLILHAELLGMTPEEQVVVANVARYHRGKLPRRKHRNLTRLDKTLRRRIERLSAILRVADGFDRGHAQVVERVKVRWGPRALRLTAVARPGAGPLRLELWGASRKTALLEALAGMPVEIVTPEGTVVRGEPESADLATA